MKAYVFPGQGSQHEGMGKELYENNAHARELFEQANEVLGWRLTDVMFGGTKEELTQTKVTQPAVFLESIVRTKVADGLFVPSAVAGHSLGEFTALTAAGVLTFEDGLRLVNQRAFAMQKACELADGTMAAVLGMEDQVVEEVLRGLEAEIVVAANYNAPGQLVISGARRGIEVATAALQAAGARRVLVLPVGGAFHSPLMKPAQDELERAIMATAFSKPICPIYQNINAEAVVNPEAIKQNLVAQLTGAVRWTQLIRNAYAAGIHTFVECGGGPGAVLRGLIRKIQPEAQVEAL